MPSVLELFGHIDHLAHDAVIVCGHLRLEAIGVDGVRIAHNESCCVLRIGSANHESHYLNWLALWCRDTLDARLRVHEHLAAHEGEIITV